QFRHLRIPAIRYRITTTEAHFRDFTQCVNTYFARRKRSLQKATFSAWRRAKTAKKAKKTY
ncbi:hypothetical protein, partial [Pantoea ananatis]|uniref:hypothetical protein n=1 Tax=Pantoea ananas TaxID=553 RepID=UPI0019D35D49